MQFSDLNLIEPILRAVAEEGYTTPTPIQEQAIRHVLEGRDLLACAQTGTGKTAAFALPILQRLAAGRSPAHPRRPIRTLVLTPTRELAAQIGESFSVYGKHLKLRNIVVFGGVGQGNQERAIATCPEILVATPGRLLDLAGQGKVNLRDIEVFVLDEADRMLDMGFIHDVRRVIALIPQKRQTLFFSATMPPDIIDLSSRILVDPARVAVAPIAATADKIEQSVYHVGKTDKGILLERVLQDPAIARVLVFTRTKHGANRVAERLVRVGIPAEAIHGNKSQGARERALAGFKSGSVRALIATDIAARGLDIDGVTHVINFDLPEVPESYVHRIGRTARAGASGIAFSFCDAAERALLTAIERLIRKRIPVVETPSFGDRSAQADAAMADRDRDRDRDRSRDHGHGRRSGAPSGNHHPPPRQSPPRASSDAHQAHQPGRPRGSAMPPMSSASSASAGGSGSDASAASSGSFASGSGSPSPTPSGSPSPERGGAPGNNGARRHFSARPTRRYAG